MYKVFFNDNIVHFTPNIEVKNFCDQVIKYTEIQDIGSFIENLVNNGETKSIQIISEDLEGGWQKFKQHFKFIEAAGGIVENRDGKYLFIKRRGLWDLPKGKSEKNESPEECAIREIAEECGINGHKLINKITDTYHTYPLKGKIVLKRTYWFNFRYNGLGTLIPQTEEDITEVKWLGKEDLPLILSNTFRSIIDVIKAAGLI